MLQQISSETCTDGWEIKENAKPFIRDRLYFSLCFFFFLVQTTDVREATNDDNINDINVGDNNNNDEVLYILRCLHKIYTITQT